MSLYYDYLNETGLKKIVELENGFATYHIRGQECYLEDVYIKPDSRLSGCAREMALSIEAEATFSGCKFFTTSVNTTIKDPTGSIKAILAYGFKFLRSEPAIIWFVKPL